MKWSSIHQSARSQLLWTVGALLAFVPLDFLALALLPWLKLSYGPPWVPWFGLGMVRCLLLGPYIIVMGNARLYAGRQPRWALRLLWGGQLIIALCAWQALYIEPFRLTVTEFTLPAPQLQGAPPLRIVQVSDLHIEYTTRREREVLAELETLAPDIIVLTGDYLNLSNLQDPQSWQDVRALLAQLHAPYGVYAINGTVDPPDVMRELFTGLPIMILDDVVMRVPLPGDVPLYLVGVSNLHWERDVLALPQVLQGVPDDAYTVLLYHTPDLAYAAAELPVDLYLAGHTHGGQLRLPFYGAIVTFSRYGKAFEQGFYDLGRLTLYVSRGLGMEGWFLPRARFLCPPELVVVTLQP